MDKIIETKFKWRINPPMILALGFMAVILAGAVLLNTGFATKTGEKVGFLNAFFTATSAVCVTGLVVVNTAATWSVFGKLVIISLIQIGGLGLMSIATMVMVILGKRIGLSERLIIKEQLNQEGMSGMVKLIFIVVKYTFAFELIGALLLALKLVPLYDFKTGIAYSLFHSISSFCNAGFDIFGNSLESFQSDPYILTVIAFLIIAGGLGFGVSMEIITKKKFRNFGLHTKLVLVTTLALIVTGTLFIYLIEMNNPNSIKGMNFIDRFFNCFFQSVTCRTAGYNSLNLSNIMDASSVLMIMLMFIGGSPASTAGGLKTTTLAVLIAATISEIRGDLDTICFRKTIPTKTIKKAIALTMVSMLLILVVSLILTVIENSRFLDLLYETVSAYGTVGLSKGVTPNLNPLSKILISSMMYLGRIGPMTLAFAIGRKQTLRTYKYAYGNITVG